MRAIAIVLALLPMTSFAETVGTDRVVRLSEPVAVTDGYEIFGSPLDVSTRVARVCQKKGCFFVAQDGTTVARVTFKDYGFFIPTDSSGKTVLVRGVLIPSQVSDERAAHLASDLGDASTRAVAAIQYEIVASAVAVPGG